MTRKILTLALLLGSFALTSCRETVREEKVREVEVRETDDEGVLERTGKEIDREVNEEIEEIGDDN